MTLFGWTFDQWAIASARYPSFKARTLCEALELKKTWNLNGHPAPGEIKFEGVEVEKNLEFSRDLFSLVGSALRSAVE